MADVTTIKALVVNADFNAGYNKALVKQCCEWANVVAFVEAKDFVVADFLPAGWRSLQATGSDAKAGSCLAVNTDLYTVKESFLVLGCHEPKDGGMLDRYIAVAELAVKSTGKQLAPMACHYPPGRYQNECGPEFTDNLRGVWDSHKTRNPLAGMDANMPIKEMAGKLNNAKGYGTEVMGWCVWGDLKVTDTVVRGGVETEGWSDHPGYQINLSD